MKSKSKNFETVSCIIPAYNERSRIEKILRVVSNYRGIMEVIVVDDGSKDNTKEVVKRFKKVKLITYKKNMGKTFAVQRAVKKAKGKFLIFIDSDLSGINKKNISDLLKPVIEKEADISIAMLNTSFHIFKILGIDFVSGQRVFKKEFISEKELSGLKGYGIEVFMNKKIMKNKLRIKVVNWKNVSNPRRREKVGLLRGTFEDYVALWHVVKTCGFFCMLKQMFLMSSLKIN